MKRLERAALGVAGLGSWVAGSIATFTGGEGSGAVALVAAGIAASVLALIGQWPSRVIFSGNEISWHEVVETVDQQIEAAQDAEDSAVVSELQDLRRRLSEAHQTGSIPVHPAAAFDEALRDALRRALPGLPISESPGQSRDRADFEMKIADGKLLVESKYKTDPQRPFMGSTLRPLLSRVRDQDRLLVVTNALNADRARNTLNDELGDRARVVSWLGPNDDGALQAAIAELINR